MLVNTKHLSDAAVFSLGISKLLPMFTGPYKITKKVGNSYRLDLPSYLKTHPTFYVGFTKPYLQERLSLSPKMSDASGLCCPGVGPLYCPLARGSPAAKVDKSILGASSAGVLPRNFPSPDHQNRPCT